MILMQANPLQGTSEVLGPSDQDFLGPEIATSKASAHLSPKKVEIFRANTLIVPITIIKSQRYLKTDW